jgi:hypothetical protein
VFIIVDGKPSVLRWPNNEFVFFMGSKTLSQKSPYIGRVGHTSAVLLRSCVPFCSAPHEGYASRSVSAHLNILKVSMTFAGHLQRVTVLLQECKDRGMQVEMRLVELTLRILVLFACTLPCSTTRLVCLQRSDMIMRPPVYYFH